ncbi:MAG: hypothetical protein IV107_11090, partial [Paucibacter sp.]|nr:hypothetical protein [Roseateles sp.]
FAIDKFIPVKGRSFNVRCENHGSEHVICTDWGITMDVPNDWLDNLDKALKPMFYRAGDPEMELAGEEQEQLESMEVVSSMPYLRSTNVKFPLELTLEFAGYQLTVDRGLGGKSNLVLLEVKVNKFKISCKEGGTVEVSYRIQAQRVSEEVRGLLSSYIKGAPTALALKPPEMKQEAIDGTKGHPGLAALNETKAAAAPKAAKTGDEAGEAFAAAVADGKTTPAAPAKKAPAGKKKPATTEPAL